MRIEPPTPVLLLLACLLCALPPGARAGGATGPDVTIWTGLVLATNEDHPDEGPPQLSKYEDKLENIFGYNEFVLVGQQSRKMRDSNEHWLVPSKDFCLHVNTRAEGSSQLYRMKLELYQNTRRLAEFEARLGDDSPLFIRGPLYAGGQLLIVLVVKEGR